uniref:Uncharacterized protein n=1 Tax=Arundo donax TaxID=35708 RepID=A0A0A9EV96_ARUDO
MSLLILKANSISSTDTGVLFQLIRMMFP